MQIPALKELHDRIGIKPDTPGYGEVFGPKSKAALNVWLSNKKAPAITEAEFQKAADILNVPIGHMKGSKKVEAPRGAYDDNGRPTILFERHKFAANTKPAGKFNRSNPDISGGPYGPGGYGSFSGQYHKLFKACTLDAEAAFKACSWGAFQVLGENAEALGYTSVFEMVASLVHSEYSHLDSYIRFITANGLVDDLRACKRNDPESCIPFVSRYNGSGFRKFNYHVKFAQAI